MKRTRTKSLPVKRDRGLLSISSRGFCLKELNWGRRVEVKSFQGPKSKRAGDLDLASFLTERFDPRSLTGGVRRG